MQKFLAGLGASKLKHNSFHAALNLSMPYFFSLKLFLL